MNQSRLAAPSRPGIRRPSTLGNPVPTVEYRSPQREARGFWSEMSMSTSFIASTAAGLTSRPGIETEALLSHWLMPPQAPAAAREPSSAGGRPSGMRRLVSAGITAAAATVASVVVGAGPAYASCAVSAAASPYQFTGLVLSTGWAGRDAQVRTLQGRVVEVIGTPGTSDQHTSVDRTYQVGSWYVFDPGNATSPFRDNICTATHPLAPSQAPTARFAVDGPAVPRIDAATRSVPRHGLATWPWAVGGTFAVAGLGALGVVHWTRRRRSSPGSSPS
jgi:hypothetical protein